MALSGFDAALSVFLRVKAFFEQDPRSAFERSLPHFEEARLQTPDGSAFAKEILSTFRPSGFIGGTTPSWTEPRAPQWLREDPRWIALCVRFRRHETLGRVARRVLRYADQGQVAAALEAATTTEPRRLIRPVTERRGDLLSRYNKGEHEAVWNLLRDYESIAGDLREEALEVARETMKRVSYDADLLIGRLRERGWTSLSGDFRAAPSSDDPPIMAEIEERTGGPIPPSLKAFWGVVGGLDLVWDYKTGGEPPDFGLDLDLIEFDPVCVEPARVVTYLFDEWDHTHEGIDPEIADPYPLELAADYLHKADISGGPPYGVELPFPGADPLWQNEEHGLPFVDYLRLAFRLGGFSRLDRHADRPDVQAFIREMTSGFEPF